MNNTFTRVILCCRSADEPLYDFLKSKIPIEIHEGSVPPMDSDGEQVLIIFDDLVLLKDQSEITEYFIRGRKKGYSCVYLTQSYYKTPKQIRINCNYIFLKKLSGRKDLSAILSEYALDTDFPQLLDAYKQATNNPLGFLFIGINPVKIHSGFNAKG